MNYRHAYHAGNFADVLKHLVLARMLTALGGKDAPYRYLDTHAGIGLYRLDGEEALKTGEWVDGIERLRAPFAEEIEAILAPYRDAVAKMRSVHGAQTYPGSPLVAATLMRRQDKAVLIEKHPDDVRTLQAVLAGDRRSKVIELDGWTALNAMIPPPERRGLVLIDPPFEERGEMTRLGRALVSAAAKWPTGSFAGWYPIKDVAEADALARQVGQARLFKLQRIEIRIAAQGERSLIGCGLLVINPPWTLMGEMDRVLPALSDRLARSGAGACVNDWLGTDAKPAG
jgi:23S rRNA (adenine2030-N6)-methyltransferase